MKIFGTRMNLVVGLFPISLENVPTVHGADVLTSVRLRNWTRYPGWSDPQKKELKTWKGCNAWYLLTSPSEALRGHDWIGLLAGREISRLPIRLWRTVASLWISFLLTVARAASDFHRSSRSSNHDELVKRRTHTIGTRKEIVKPLSNRQFPDTWLQWVRFESLSQPGNDSGSGSVLWSTP